MGPKERLKKTNSLKTNSCLNGVRSCVYSLSKSLYIAEPVWPAVKRTMVKVEAVATAGDTRVGALVEVETSPARGALVAAATDAGLTQRGALLAALPIVTEKAAGAL